MASAQDQHRGLAQRPSVTLVLEMAEQLADVLHSSSVLSIDHSCNALVLYAWCFTQDNVSQAAGGHLHEQSTATAYQAQLYGALPTCVYYSSSLLHQAIDIHLWQVLPRLYLLNGSAAVRQTAFIEHQSASGQHAGVYGEAEREADHN